MGAGGLVQGTGCGGGCSLPSLPSPALEPVGNRELVDFPVRLE